MHKPFLTNARNDDGNRSHKVRIVYKDISQLASGYVFAIFALPFSLNGYRMMETIR